MRKIALFSTAIVTSMAVFLGGNEPGCCGHAGAVGC
ncbi:hypothetical protein J2S49_001394 [Arcanobacterium wilhelmae]|uniref:Uncharacterized protein n=1 Tax=Arcanobacterium wilhelmae TaxID=1803177 RepID=A0ABT9NCS2_9ACTO|nr:hypothetical protein [Arcanobacterium wilhelmae]